MEIPPGVIESAAQALCADDANNGIGEEAPFSWESIPEYHREFYRETARVVLEAAFLKGAVHQQVRVQFGPEDNRRYTKGGAWDSRPVNSLLTSLDVEENLVVERKLVVEFLHEPIAIVNEEVL